MEDVYQVMSVLGQVWHGVAKMTNPALLLVGSLGIILATYLSLADLHLAFFFHVLAALGAVAGAGVMFEHMHELVGYTRLSQGILARLLSLDESYLNGKTRKERIGILKRAKAFRPFLTPVGPRPFCNGSIGVNQVVWEEILNQVLFLVSL